MSLQNTPASERVHIAFFGRRNAGKSSLVNALTGQDLSIVSETKGTTTDPVQKTMELLPLGPVVIIDTPGLDDEGALGKQRVQRARRVLDRTDIAVLVVTGEELDEGERAFVQELDERKIPRILVRNSKEDTEVDVAMPLFGRIEASPRTSPGGEPALPISPEGVLRVNAKTGEGIAALKEKLAELGRQKGPSRPIARDLVPEGGLAVLVIPIDASAPKGRLILPQQQTLRDLLDSGRTALCVQPQELAAALARLASPPDLVITDSQAFSAVAEIVPEKIPLTSFSILMARYKGTLDAQVRGVRAIAELADGDRVLMAEGCTHHRQCQDIGTVKIPNWILESTGRDLIFETSSGPDFPVDLSPYRLVVHCGGCMLNEREVQHRLAEAERQGVPFTNYGLVIAHTQGILDRSLRALGL